MFVLCSMTMQNRSDLSLPAHNLCPSTSCLLIIHDAPERHHKHNEQPHQQPTCNMPDLRLMNQQTATAHQITIGHLRTPMD